MPSEPEPLLPDEEDDRPELVFALVVPVGTPKDRLVASLKSGLRQYGYQSEVIKLSSLLLDRDPDLASRTSGASEEKRVEALMEAGDRFCEDATNDAALVLEAVLDIGARRRSDGEATREHYKWAWIIDSLKRPGELDELRKIYGDHVVAIGCQASRQTRRRRMVDLIAPRSPSLPDEKIEAKIESLLSRDLDGAGPFRQNIVNTFSLSDVFINCDESEGCEREVQRLLDLLFGNPEAEKPTDMEFGMYLASGVAMRSPELGRQVGAAILQGGSITSVGVNSHPTEPSQAPHFDASKVDLSRLVLDTVQRLARAGHLRQDATDSLDTKPDEFVALLLGGALRGSQLSSLTEFQVPVHAEMAALLEALSSGRQVRGQTIYVTTYPCHGCARHLLRAGLDVVYLDPYPKSRAAAMYGRDGADRFRAFTGIAPSRYRQPRSFMAE